MVYSIKELKTAGMATPQAHRPSKLGALLDGSDSWTQLESKINTLITGLKYKESTYSVHLQPALEEISLGRAQRNSWQEAQLVPPSQTYVRAFGRTFGTTHL